MFDFPSVVVGIIVRGRRSLRGLWRGASVSESGLGEWGLGGLGSVLIEREGVADGRREG